MTDGDFLNINKYITHIYKLHPNTNMVLGPQKLCGAQGRCWGGVLRPGGCQVLPALLPHAL